MNDSVHRKKPLVTLVGAGPGDPELLTLKAVRIIGDADIVLYDALVSDEILKHIPSGIPAFSVGKRAGAPSFRQEEINALMVEFAKQYGHVVRLKGGDPFVFGRGQEEVDHLISHGIDVSVVPGISSALAVPAGVHIPLTLRGVSESFWVVTGTTKSGEISGDIFLAAQSAATVVILMGLNHLQEIAHVFIQHHKGHLPVAVIQNGTLPDEKFVKGSVDSIVDLVRLEGLASPAVIVIGEVAAYATSRVILDVTKKASMHLAAQS
jgi:uroporphyrin-III C-methyltransferase